MSVTLVSAWSNRNFRRVWGASTAGTLGTEVGELAIPIVALITLSASAQELSWIRTASFLPYLLLTLWLGVLVDRWRRRRLMIGAELLSGVILLLIAILGIVGILTVPVLIVGVFLLGSLAVLHMLANFSFVPLVVSREQLQDANARITATQSAISMGGSGVGGALVQAVTAPVAMLMDGASHLLSAFFLKRVQVTEEPPVCHTDSVVAQAREGLVTLWRHRVVRALGAEATLWNLGNEVLMLALTIAVVSERRDGPLALGFVLMASGAGAFLGAATSARITARFGYGRSLITAMLLGNTAPLIGVLLTHSTATASLIVLAVAFLVSGVGIGVANSQAVTVRQLSVPDPLRGRVNAAYRLLSWGALAIGALGAGLVISKWGVWPAAVLGSTLMALATVPVALSPIRRMHHLDDHPPPAETRS